MARAVFQSSCSSGPSRGRHSRRSEQEKCREVRTGSLAGEQRRRVTSDRRQSKRLHHIPSHAKKGRRHGHDTNDRHVTINIHRNVNINTYLYGQTYSYTCTFMYTNVHICIKFYKNCHILLFLSSSSFSHSCLFCGLAMRRIAVFFAFTRTVRRVAHVHSKSDCQALPRKRPCRNSFCLRSSLEENMFNVQARSTRRETDS